MLAPLMANMASLKALDEPFGRVASEPVEDTDPSSFITDMSLKSNYPVQVTDPQDNVTLQLSSVPPGYLTPPMDRIQQPVENDASEFICPGSIAPDFTKDLQCLSSSCEKCLCSIPAPKISDLLDDEDLLYSLRLKLDPTHCTIKNWKNFASRWGMSYDELTLLEQRTHGSTYHSPTQEFLLRYSQKPVTELTKLCQFYQRIDVLKLLQQWVENDWPSRWRRPH
ncbi:ectodysplasin-A receptor-associated adapter protein [Astyanax mexicanus]|uniref:Ectodysplasin-A receptor-associated adapter protein n=1 Tax=Astyanax mexicanus TaxID=7994 RepID=W5KUG4_ASTMX|nr:ectodysplasin-A receptor-associated adapter protein [Astyanax mexicanus]